MTKAIKSFLMLFTIIVSILLAANLSSGEILIQSGFEGDPIGDIPQGDTWQVSGGGFEVDSSHAKAGGQNLSALGGGGDQALGAAIQTQSPVITTEFWLFVDGVERSLTFFLLGADTGLTDWAAAGPYINWIGDKVRYYAGAWEEIGDFASGEWHYVRIVADTGASVFHVYVADSLAEARSSDPIGADLNFRSEIPGPPANVCFGTYGLVSPVYIDELLVYEGDVFPANISTVDSRGKLTLTWGEVKEYGSPDLSMK